MIWNKAAGVYGNVVFEKFRERTPSCAPRFSKTEEALDEPSIGYLPILSG